MPNDDLDLSYISDEEPTREMTWEELVAFCGGDELRAYLYLHPQSDVVEDLPEGPQGPQEPSK